VRWWLACTCMVCAAGRLAYVREVLGMEAELVEYCAAATSLENALLLAWRQPAAGATAAVAPAAGTAATHSDADESHEAD
jgi:hypothetical protein